MWGECQSCKFCTNSPAAASEHEKTTGHLVIVQIDWTDNEEEVY